MKPATAKVLRLLREAGDQGLTTSELVQAGAGNRFGARILELRAEGHRISTRRVGPSRHRYTLLPKLGAHTRPVSNGGAAAGGLPASLPASRGTPPSRVYRGDPGFSYDRPPSVIGEWDFIIECRPPCGTRTYWQRRGVPDQLEMAA